MSGLYDKGRQKFLEGSLHWLTDTIKVQFIDTANYTVNLATHEFLSDIPSAARVGPAQELSAKSSANGVADAEDTAFTALTGDGVEAIVLYKEGAGEGSSPLIAYLDQGIGIEFTPDGGNVVIVWPSTANKIFKL